MTAITTAGTPGVNRFTRSQLLRTARLFATDPDLERAVDLDATERSWHRLDATAHRAIWLIHRPVGSTTGWHAHLQSEGAFLTVKGDRRGWPRCGCGADRTSDPRPPRGSGRARRCPTRTAP